jgi:methylthioribose-1-phosphate isomerase
MVPDGVEVENPAFDVTPSNYVTAIITERGVARAPYQESLRNLAEQHLALGTQQLAGVDTTSSRLRSS